MVIWKWKFGYKNEENDESVLIWQLKMHGKWL